MNPRARTYLESQQNRLHMLRMMWEDPLVQCYDNKNLPREAERWQLNSIFLAGPTSRSQSLESNWRSEAVALLRTFGFDGYIYVPEPRGQENQSDFTEKKSVHIWESSRLMSADFVVFWIPRNTSDLIGLNTNLELGIFLGKAMSGGLNMQRLFIGWPEGSEHMGLSRHYAEIAQQNIYSNLEKFCDFMAQQNKI